MKQQKHEWVAQPGARVIVCKKCGQLKNRKINGRCIGTTLRKAKPPNLKNRSG